MSKKKTPAASLKRRKHGLGLPIHIKKVPILLNIGCYIILALNYLYILPIYITYILPVILNSRAVFGFCAGPTSSPARLSLCASVWPKKGSINSKGPRRDNSKGSIIDIYICIYMYMYIIYIYIYIYRYNSQGGLRVLRSISRAVQRSQTHDITTMTSVQKPTEL